MIRFGSDFDRFGRPKTPPIIGVGTEGFEVKKVARCCLLFWFASKTAQETPKRLPDPPKSAQRGSKRPPRRPRRLQEGLKRPQEPAKRAQDTPKMPCSGALPQKGGRAWQKMAGGRRCPPKGAGNPPPPEGSERVWTGLRNCLRILRNQRVMPAPRIPHPPLLLISWAEVTQVNST